MHRPGFYADRFQQFMCNTVFKKIPRTCTYRIEVVASICFLLVKRPSSSLPLCFHIQSPVKPSPSKKSRGGGQTGLRRAPTLGAQTPLSHATGQSSIDGRLVYHSHFRSTEAEADSGKKSDVTGKVIRRLNRFVSRRWILVLKYAVFIPYFVLRDTGSPARSSPKDPSFGRKPC